MEVIAARLDEDNIEQFQKVIQKNKSEVVRELVDAGRKHYAVELYKEKKVSLGLGARLARMPLGEFLELLASHNVNINLSLEDAKAALKTAEKLLIK